MTAEIDNNTTQRDKYVAGIMGTKNDSWVIMDSSVTHYDASFRSVLKGETITSLARRRYKELGRPLYAIDFLATPAAIRSLAVAPGIELQGLSVSLSEQRRQRTQQNDSKRGIRHVVADLGRPGTYHTLLRELGDNKADIILQRGWGGLNLLPKDASYYEVAFNAMLTMMNEGAILLTQLPGLLEGADLVSPDLCVAALVDQGVDAYLGDNPTSIRKVMRVEKTHDTPKRIRLPLT